MFNASDAPQPPKVLTTPLEIAANLRQLLDSHDPLIITFPERSQRFQSYVVHVDRDANTLALDEMIPRDGEKYIENGEPFRIEGFHDGVRIAWECNTATTTTENDGHRYFVSGGGGAPLPAGRHALLGAGARDPLRRRGLRGQGQR